MIGVSYWHMPDVVPHAVDEPNYGKLGDIRATRSYKSHDYVKVRPDLLPNFAEKTAMFFREHLHEDEEIRFCLDGRGYFDVHEDIDGRWIRIEVQQGDMIVLPPGMYHRFTVDTTDYVHMMRLFKDNPKWEAINRGETAEGTLARQTYLKDVISPRSAKNEAKSAVRTLVSANGESFTLTNSANALANYPHLRAYGGLLYVSGISSRLPTNPPSHAGARQRTDGTWEFDIAEQTRGVLSNISAILSAAGADLSHVIDLTTYLVNMDDYAGYNAAYNQFFPSSDNAPTRTTVAVKQLPHPHLLIEIKVVAVDPRAAK